MIRPITCLAFLAACGSGLYLYQAKHRVQVLDHQIEQTVHDTDKLREQTRMLHAEWTLLNDPERLRQLANQFLTLQTVSPTQYTSMADLDARLPAVALPPPPTEQPEVPAITDVPVAQAEPPPAVNAAEPASTQRQIAAASTPRQIAAASTPRQIAAASSPLPRPPETRAPRPVVAMARPTDPHIHDVRFDPHPAERHIREARAEPHRIDILAEPRPYVPHPVVARRFVANVDASPRFARPLPAPQPYGGSLLGMAHGQPNVPAPMPLPRPMPVNDYSTTSGGG